MSPAKLSNRHGRDMGDECIFVRNTILSNITRVTVDTECGVVLKLDKDLLNADKSLMFIGVYIPPERSPFYENVSSGLTGINMLEIILSDDEIKSSEVDILISGDMNARVGKLSDMLDIDGRIPEFSDTEYNFDNADFLDDRESCDD